MSEALKNIPPLAAHQQLQDPSIMGGEAIATHELQINYRTFAEAQAAPKRFSDEFIDGCLDGSLSVGSEKDQLIKGFLDKAPMTEEDHAVATDPERVAGLYLQTAEVVARNLKIRVAPGGDPDVRSDKVQKVKAAKASFLDTLADEAPKAADVIADMCETGVGKFPRSAVEFRGLEVDGHDLLDMDHKGSKDVRANIRVQRQATGSFIMGYTDSRVVEKQEGHDEPLGKRIYLNPNIEAAPYIFEQLLQTANEGGLSLQLKLFQRSAEALMASRDSSKDSMRGDGIVMYVGEDEADEALAMVLALAEDIPDAFVGRATSKVPMKVADGIAVGDEPLAKGQSLTSHRSDLFWHAEQMTKKLGVVTPEKRREVFRRNIAKLAELNQIDPHNIAFNKAA